MAETRRSKKQKRTVSHGVLHVQASFNNTIITISDKAGNVLAQSSAGALGFRGSKKGTAYAAQTASDKVITAVKQAHGIKALDVSVKGVGLGRDAAVRAIANHDIAIESITDVTGVPHGGCRPRKERRA